MSADEGGEEGCAGHHPGLADQQRRGAHDVRPDGCERSHPALASDLEAVERAALRRADRTFRTGRGTPEFSARIFGPLLDDLPGPVLDLGAGDSPPDEGRGTVRLDAGYRNDPPDDLRRAVVAVCENLPFRDGAFSAVVACFVLQHVADIGRCMAECLRVTSSSGFVAVYPVRRGSRTLNRHPLAVAFASSHQRGGLFDVLVVRPPQGAEDVRRLAEVIAASGVLRPPWIVRIPAGWLMRVWVAWRGTARTAVRPAWAGHAVPPRRRRCDSRD